MPDFRAALRGAASAGDVVWSGWARSGHRSDGAALDLRGAIVMGVADDRVRWARLYMEETEHDGADVEATMRRLAGTPPRG